MFIKEIKQSIICHSVLTYVQTNNTDIKKGTIEIKLHHIQYV